MYEAIATLALSFGANIAVFQLLDAVRVRSLPIPGPQQLVRIRVHNGNGGREVSRDIYALTLPRCYRAVGFDRLSGNPAQK